MALARSKVDRGEVEAVAGAVEAATVISEEVVADVDVVADSADLEVTASIVVVVATVADSEEVVVELKEVSPRRPNRPR